MHATCLQPSYSETKANGYLYCMTKGLMSSLRTMPLVGLLMREFISQLPRGGMPDAMVMRDGGPRKEDMGNAVEEIKGVIDNYLQDLEQAIR